MRFCELNEHKYKHSRLISALSGQLLSQFAEFLTSIRKMEKGTEESEKEAKWGPESDWNGGWTEEGRAQREKREKRRGRRGRNKVRARQFEPPAQINGPPSR